MSEDDVRSLADMAGLTIDPAYLPGVIRNLEILRGQAAVLAQMPVDQHVEPAPAFRA